ncbi:hypothetical protein CSUI_009438 [Cystoisospora suis]|uniref:Uncharacterized protein n=1 Tax=Cystoisospora suis TaxID=483139 RepID=A0A2C6KJT1_9APIC|nr:hypothetical protein CSUI_009438 [Cystoisospora suis]
MYSPMSHYVKKMRGKRMNEDTPRQRRRNIKRRRGVYSNLNHKKKKTQNVVHVSFFPPSLREGHLAKNRKNDLADLRRRRGRFVE